MSELRLGEIVLKEPPRCLPQTPTVMKLKDKKDGPRLQNDRRGLALEIPEK